jgi:hypothetical protein
MKKMANGGFVSGSGLWLVISSVIAVIAIIFSVWAYNGRETYKNQDQSLINNAVAQAKIQEQQLLQSQFTAQSQNPFISYSAPAQYGSVTVYYPRTWSGYVDTTGSDGNPVDGYFDPGVVPAIGGQNSVYALRVQINSNSYSSQLANYTNQQQSTGLSITPYSLNKVPSVVGVMIQGQLQQNIQGVLIMLPLRTDTLEIWTESTQYTSLFTNQILPQITFKP